MCWCTIKRVIPSGITLLILCWNKGLERLNATVRWTVAHARLDGHDTLIFTKGENANESLPAYPKMQIESLPRSLPTAIDNTGFLVEIRCRFIY